MNKLLFTLPLVFVALCITAQDKFKETKNVKKIKEQVYVYTSGENYFWTTVGEDKGREYIDELLFLEEGDEITYFMKDIKNPFEAIFSSEQGVVLAAIPQKKGEEFVLRGTHKIETTGDYTWRFLAFEKDAFLYNPSLTIIAAKSTWAKYRNAVGLRNHLEFLIAMAPLKFVPIQGDFIEKDIKETRYQSTYKFDDHEAEVKTTLKGTVYKSILYSGKNEADAQKVQAAVEDKIIEILKENCYTGPEIDDKPPFSLYRSYHKVEFTGCGNDNVLISLVTYKYRDDYAVDLEITYLK
jgi:hypothetical protein